MQNIPEVDLNYRFADSAEPEELITRLFPNAVVTDGKEEDNKKPSNNNNALAGSLASNKETYSSRVHELGNDGSDNLDHVLQLEGGRITDENRPRYLNELKDLALQTIGNPVLLAKIVRHAVEVSPQDGAETLFTLMNELNNRYLENYGFKKMSEEDSLAYFNDYIMALELSEIYDQVSQEYSQYFDPFMDSHNSAITVYPNHEEDNPYNNPRIRVSLFNLPHEIPELVRYKDHNTNELIYCLEDQLPLGSERVDLFTDEELRIIREKARELYFEENDEEQYISPGTLLLGDPIFESHPYIIAELEKMDFSDPKVSFALGKALPETIAMDSLGSLREYVDIFNKIDSNHYLPALLDNIKSTNASIRRMSAEILYRLELGKMGATQQGVEYLGKLYDLGKYNDPDFFVRRLNNSGLMAVLAEKEGNIEGVFPLDLYTEEDAIQSEVRELMSQELFLPKADETPQQRQQREHYLQLFLENYENIFNDDFFKGTGIRINSLDLHEQGWFLLNYLELSEQENTEDLMRLKSFVKQYGEYGLKSFLALEYGGSGKEILDFAEVTELTKEEKLTIFRNFYSIASEASNWRKVFDQVEKGVGHEFAPQVHEAFVRKNAEFFRAAQMIARGEGGDVTIKELLQNMNTVTFSLRVLKGIYEDDSNLHLEQKPQTQDEYDKDGNLIESASSSFTLIDKHIGARVVVSVRSQPTVRQGNISGGEARINFSVTNLATKERARIGFDLSDYGEFIGEADRLPVVSLDMGIGKLDRETGTWPSQRAGRVLGLVEGSEGGHNELSFSPEVAEHFPDITERFRGYIETKFVE